MLTIGETGIRTVRTPGTPLTDAVEAANAALADTGYPPIAGRRHGRLGVQRSAGVPLEARSRAAALGIIYEHGPGYLMRCATCAAADRSCETRADAVLRGVTCR